MVSRSGRQQRAFLGACASHQAADAAGIYATAVYVLPGDLEPAVSSERAGGRDADPVPSRGAGVHSGGLPEGDGQGLEQHARAYAHAGGEEVGANMTDHKVVSEAEWVA